MRLLLDTHLLLWAAYHPGKLPKEVVRLLNTASTPLFSIASLWEVSIKHGYGRMDFDMHPRQFRQGLIDGGYEELPIGSEHAFSVAGLPPIHRDPFDRMLIAQAIVDGIDLLTSDATVARYPGPIRYFA